MSKKVSKKRFIQTIENNEDGLTNKELAYSLGISEAYFYDLRRRYRQEIRDVAKEMATEVAVEQIQNLRRIARKGNVRAALALLEIAGVYALSNRQKTESDNQKIPQGIIYYPPKLPVGAPVECKLMEPPKTSA